MKSLTRLIIKGNRLRCATKRVNDSPKAKTATTCKYSNSMWNTKWCTTQFLNELDSRSNVKETRLFHEKTSIVICSFLLFSHYSSSLPISFEIEIISSVWNFTSFLLSEFAAINHSIALTKWVCAMWSSSEQLQQWNNSITPPPLHLRQHNSSSPVRIFSPVSPANVSSCVVSPITLPPIINENPSGLVDTTIVILQRIWQTVLITTARVVSRSIIANIRQTRLVHPVLDRVRGNLIPRIAPSIQPARRDGEVIAVDTVVAAADGWVGELGASQYLHGTLAGAVGDFERCANGVAVFIELHAVVSVCCVGWDEIRGLRDCDDCSKRADEWDFELHFFELSWLRVEIGIVKR